MTGPWPDTGAAVEVSLHGGPKHGVSFGTDALNQALMIPSVEVPAGTGRIDPRRPPVPVFLYRLAIELHSPKGVIYATYGFEGTRMPDGSTIDPEVCGPGCPVCEAMSQ